VLSHFACLGYLFIQDERLTVPPSPDPAHPPQVPPGHPERITATPPSDVEMVLWCQLGYRPKRGMP
jgi:hypothetical protein